MKYLTKKDIALRKRDANSHKGDNGRVLIIGGSQDYAGAPALAAIAALRAGCDIAVVAAPEKVAWAINAVSPDIITKKLPGEHFRMAHAAQIINMAENFDCILIGNGAGQHLETKSFLHRVIRKISESGKPMVIDADALKLDEYAGKNSLLDELNNVVFTPHRKEFELFTGVKLPIGFEDKAKVVSSAVQSMNGSNVILLKGRRDIIASKDNLLINQTGNEGMTVGGTGDVLAGVTASFIAQKNDLFVSACAAAYVTGLAGDMRLKTMGIGFIASDLTYQVPFAARALRR